MPFASDCLDTLGVSPRRLRTISLGQCTCTTVQLELVDPRTGEPLNLNLYYRPESSSSSLSSSSLAPGFCGAPVLDEDGNPKNYVEVVGKGLSSDFQFAFAIKASIVDAANGIINIPFDPTDSQFAGVFISMAIIWENGIQRKHYPFYTDITPNVLSYNPHGPLAFYEVRMALRDVSPELNFLIDELEYKDEELMWAMRRPIDYWNEIPPPVGIFSPANFPYRYHWLEAVCGELMRMVAVWLRRNDLDYQAGGVSVADTKKWPEYARMADQRINDWRQFVRAKKIEVNIQNAYGSLGGYPSEYLH